MIVLLCTKKHMFVWKTS